MRHMPQLDGLQGLAVLAVVASHSFGSDSWVDNLGVPAVRLFFVLSGFLITGILLRARDSAPAPRVLGAFYARRVLRIFPIYYATLFAAAAVGLPRVREGFWWHAGYLSNVWVAREGSWQGPASHFWSLAVEEQFYLVWPFVVLLAPQRWLVGSFWACVVAAPIFRAAVFTSTANPLAPFVLMPGCLDALCLGALLASGRVPMRAALFCGMALTVAGFLCSDATAIAHAARPLGTALTAAWVIGRAAEGFGGPVGAVLAAGPLARLGTISYGVYVLHNFVMPALLHAEELSGVNLPSPGPGWLRFAFVAAASVTVATVSWRLMEKPLNDLKSRFPYSRKQPRPDSPDGSSGMLLLVRHARGEY